MSEENSRIKKILIPVVKSEYNDKIISYAIILAKGSGASITAIHVLDKSAQGDLGDLFPMKVEEYEKATSKRAEELLTEYNKLLRRKELKPVSKLLVPNQ